MASAPRVAEEHLAAAAEQPVEGRGHLPAGLGAEQVRHVQQRARLLGERVGHRRVGVAEAGDGEARQEVEVALAVGVPELGALAAHERDRRRP